jgi:hypothetical protein
VPEQTGNVHPIGPSPPASQDSECAAAGYPHIQACVVYATVKRRSHANACAARTMARKVFNPTFPM